MSENEYVCVCVCVWYSSATFPCPGNRNTFIGEWVSMLADHNKTLYHSACVHNECLQHHYNAKHLWYGCIYILVASFCFRRKCPIKTETLVLNDPGSFVRFFLVCFCLRLCLLAKERIESYTKQCSHTIDIIMFCYVFSFCLENTALSLPKRNPQNLNICVLLCVFSLVQAIMAQYKWNNHFETENQISTHETEWMKSYWKLARACISQCQTKKKNEWNMICKSNRLGQRDWKSLLDTEKKAVETLKAIFKRFVASCRRCFN